MSSTLSQEALESIEADRKFQQNQREYNALAYHIFVENEHGRLFFQKTLDGLRDAPPFNPAVREFNWLLAHNNGYRAFVHMIQQCIKSHASLLLKGVI
jgi:hypothetical protein